MKMKRWLKLAVAGLAVLTVAGCTSGSSAQDEYTDVLNETSNAGDYNGAEFEFKINKLDLNTETMGDSSSEQAKLIMDMVKDMSLSGNYKLDKENEAIEYSFDLDIGQKIIMDFVMTSDAVYYSGDSFSSIIDVVYTFMGVNSVDYSNLNEEISGKYIKYGAEDLGEDYGVLEDFDFSALTSGGEGDTLLADFSKTLDASTFEKKDNVVSHTYTKEELADLIAYVKENGEDEVKEALKDVDETELTSTDFLKQLDLTVSADTETKKMSYQIVFVMEDDAAGDKVDIDITMTVTPKKEDGSVKVPADSLTITPDEFMEMMEQGASYVLSDDQFDSMYEMIKEYPDLYPVEEIEDLMEDYSLTDDQKAKLNEVYGSGAF